jgi:hypothetical protein
VPYVAEQDVTVPRVIASGQNADGSTFYETDSVTYGEGAVVSDDQIAPDVLDRLESGDDEHLSSLLRHVSESEAKEIRASQAEAQGIAPEHEAEAEVLRQDGRDVLDRDQVIESNPNGDPEGADEAATSSGSGSSEGDGPTKDELADRAAELGVKGRSSMNKDELADAIASAEAAQAKEAAQVEADQAGEESESEG